MRVVVITVAALVTLGLAAFGVVAAQRSSGPGSAAALFARIASLAENTKASIAENPKAPPPAAEPSTAVPHAVVKSGRGGPDGASLGRAAGGARSDSCAEARS